LSPVFQTTGTLLSRVVSAMSDLSELSSGIADFPTIRQNGYFY
jgi:hypothetical protein